MKPQALFPAGVWGPKTQAAYEEYQENGGKPRFTLPKGVTRPDQIKTYQKMLNVDVDGIWGEKTQAAYDRTYGSLSGDGSAQFPSAKRMKAIDAEIKRNKASDSYTPSYATLPSRESTLDAYRAYTRALGEEYVAPAEKKTYTAPMGVTKPDQIKTWQRIVGAKQDGKWGPESQAQYESWQREREEAQEVGRELPRSQNNTHREPGPYDKVIDQVLDKLEAEGWEQNPYVTGRYLPESDPMSDSSLEESLWNSIMDQRENKRRSIMRDASEAKKYPALVKYYTPAQYAVRSEEDNAAMDALGSLYKKFQSGGDAQDADNLLTHIDRYAGQANGGRKGQSDPYFQQDYSNGYYNSVGERNENGEFENGYVQINTVTESTASVFDWLLYGVGSSLAGYLYPALNLLGKAQSVTSGLGKLTNFPLYYSFRPQEVVKPEDTVIYYSAYSSGGSGNYYYFRGDEFLFSADDGGSLLEAGVNFWNDVAGVGYGVYNGIKDVLNWGADKGLSAIWKRVLPNIK